MGFRLFCEVKKRHRLSRSIMIFLGTSHKLIYDAQYMMLSKNIIDTVLWRFSSDLWRKLTVIDYEVSSSVICATSRPRMDLANFCACTIVYFVKSSSVDKLLALVIDRCWFEFHYVTRFYSPRCAGIRGLGTGRGRGQLDIGRSEAATTWCGEAVWSGGTRFANSDERSANSGQRGTVNGWSKAKWLVGGGK